MNSQAFQHIKSAGVMYVKISHKPGDAVWVKDDDGRILAGNITEVRLKLPHLSDLEAAGSLAQEFSVLVAETRTEYDELEAYDPKSDACRQDPDAYRYVYATRQLGEDYDRFCSTQARSHA